MIYYADIIDNDVVNGEGISVSVWLAGCPHECEGCHNPELWSFSKNKPIDEESFFTKMKEIIEKNGITRNLSILGGEPLSPFNINTTLKICKWFKEEYPKNEVFVWTGYRIEDLKYKETILDNIDVLIDGRFEKDKRDIRLKLRGSSNQRILRKNIDF